MKWRWSGGVDRKAKLLGECWTFFNLHFPAPAIEAMSRICAWRTEKNLQIFGWCFQFKQSCLWATLSYFCLQKQGRKINAMRRVVLENVLKRAQRYPRVKCEKVSLQIESTALPPKNHNLFVKTGTKKELETRKCGHRLIMHSITRRDEMWGGVRWEDSGREGVGGSFVPTYIWAGWNGMTIHILSNPIKKGHLLTAIQIWGTAETRRFGADAVRLQVITQNYPLTLCASYLPLPPPPQLRPLFSESSLSSPLLIRHMVHRGVPK